MMVILAPLILVIQSLDASTQPLNLIAFAKQPLALLPIVMLLPAIWPQANVKLPFLNVQMELCARQTAAMPPLESAYLHQLIAMMEMHALMIAVMFRMAASTPLSMPQLSAMMVTLALLTPATLKSDV
jgi:hypothetical protein